MKFILGTKQNMTQIFSDEGVVIPVTKLIVSPVIITQVKTTEKEGYDAIQVGYGEKKAKNIGKSLRGHIKELGNFTTLKEVRLDGSDKKDYTVGDKIDASVFSEGDKVVISSISKGKGFQGVVKRHGFHGGPGSHGQKHSEREAGSIGTAGFQRVFKNKRMAGRMGSDKVTAKNVKIVKVDLEKNEIYVKGAVAGRRGTLVEILGSLK